MSATITGIVLDLVELFFGFAAVGTMIACFQILTKDPPDRIGMLTGLVAVASFALVLISIRRARSWGRC